MIRSISSVNLFIKDEHGKPYANKKLWIRGGVEKNEEYCYAANLGPNRNHLSDGKKDQVFTTDDSGKISVYFDSTQFYSASEETIEERRLQLDDILQYDLELKFQLDEDIEKCEKVYEPQMVHATTVLNPYNVVNNCNVDVQARLVKTGAMPPVINDQLLIQKEKDTGYIGNVSDIYGYKGAIDPSNRYPTAIVQTETLMWGQRG